MLPTFCLWLVLPISVVESAVERRYFQGIERLSLNAPRSSHVWTASAVNESNGNDIKVPVSVPGGIYSDLEELGLLPTPIFHEYNDQEVLWVGRQNWNFTRRFRIQKALFEKRTIVLVCEGLDTVAQVFINNHLVGTSENMFVRYIYDIKSALKLGENKLRIAFQSPVKYADEQYRQHTKKFGYSIYPSKVAYGFRGESRVQMIRKIQSSFSWDWGPSYANVGIWKSIYIEGFNSAIIRDVLAFTTPSKAIPDETSTTQWNVTIRVYYDSSSDAEAYLELSRPNSPRLASRRVYLERGNGKSLDIDTVETGDVVKLWWPNGYGHQNLYWYNISLSSDTESSSQSLRIGFRTVNLIEDSVQPTQPSQGSEFYLLVNGLKIYSKGSNTVPLHALPERITETQTEWLLRAARMSHQNLVRVWGGGMYESETFYDYADEYGIMVWEDFKFACALYPATPEFLKNVGMEVDTQVKRLQHRPSLVLWAGNNENEGALRHGWWSTSYKFTRYASDYVKLYVDTIKTRVEELDPSRKYIASSPTNGEKTEKEGWLAREPYDLKYGDLHFYNYQLDDWDWHTFPRTRYASEYGYQSCPYYDSLAEVSDNISTWTWRSEMMEHRQRHFGGLDQISDFIAMHFPTSGEEDDNNLEAFPLLLYLAQVTQAVGQKTQTEFYRRLQDKLAENGTGHNMGALYWQLNDVWQGCSWASVEVKGRWKLLMYYAKTFFAPVLASPYKNEGGDVVIELISDLPTDFRGKLNVRVFKLSSLKPVYEQSVPVFAPFLTSREVVTITHTELENVDCGLESNATTSDPCLVYTSLLHTPDNFLLLQYPTEPDTIPDPNLQVNRFSDEGDNRTVHFTLTTSTVALFVFLTVRGDHMGYFSENGFILVEPSKELTYYSEFGITSHELRNRLEILSLKDMARYVESTRGE